MCARAAREEESAGTPIGDARGDRVASGARHSVSAGDIALLAVALAALFIGLGRRAPTRIHELRVLETAREMWESGDLLVPRFCGEERFQKPPLAYWLAVAGYALAGGPDEAAGRLYSAVSAALTAILLLAFGRTAGSPRRGLFAALVFVTSALATRGARRAETDCILALWTTAAVLSFARALDPPPAQDHGAGAPGSRRTLWLTAGWASAALGFLAKGPAGLAYPLSAIALYVVASRRWRDLGRLFAPTGIAVFSALAIPWFAAVILREGHSLDVFFSELGTVTAGGGHRKGILYGLFYYSVHIPAEFAPWFPLLIPAALGLARGRWREGKVPLVLAWAAGILAILHAIGQKQPHYLLPALPPLALLVAGWIDGGEPWAKWAPPAWRARAVRAVASIAIGASLAWTYGLFGAEDGRVREFAAEARPAIEAAGGAPIYALGEDPPALCFHLGRVVLGLRGREGADALFARGERFFAISRPPAAAAPAPWDPASDPRFRLVLEAPRGPRALRLYRAEPDRAR